jgi:hypothetical protein
LSPLSPAAVREVSGPGDGRQASQRRVRPWSLHRQIPAGEPGREEADNASHGAPLFDGRDNGVGDRLIDPEPVPGRRGPPRLERRVNEPPGFSSVPPQTMAGSRGCLRRTVVPTVNSPLPRRRATLTESVHVGHRSTSVNLPRASAGVAAMSTHISPCTVCLPTPWGSHRKGRGCRASNGNNSETVLEYSRNRVGTFPGHPAQESPAAPGGLGEGDPPQAQLPEAARRPQC